MLTKEQKTTAELQASIKTSDNHVLLRDGLTICLKCANCLETKSFYAAPSAHISTSQHCVADLTPVVDVVTGERHWPSISLLPNCYQKNDGACPDYAPKE